MYFCLADFDIIEVTHYGLAVPLYTHFTSPIRRYADVLVHRLLAASIDIQSLTNDMTDKFKMARQCDQMNRKTRMARFASSASTQYNTYVYFKNLIEKEKREIIEEAIVMRISKAGVYIMVKAYGIEGLLSDPSDQGIEVDSEKEEAKLGATVIRNFDNLRVQILPLSVEFRRQIKFIFKEKVEASKKRAFKEIEENKD